MSNYGRCIDCQMAVADCSCSSNEAPPPVTRAKEPSKEAQQAATDALRAWIARADYIDMDRPDWDALVELYAQALAAAHARGRAAGIEACITELKTWRRVDSQGQHLIALAFRALAGEERGG